MNLLINYANRIFRDSQQLNSKTGIEVGGFDRVISYAPRDLDWFFFLKNRKILSAPRGNGYWLWKPYFIRKSLQLLKPNDYLFYADSGSYFISSIQPIIDICEQTGQDIIPFDTRRIEYQYTKRDAFVLLECDTPEFTNTIHRLGGFLLCKKTSFTMEFIENLLKHDQDERLITDMPNVMGLPNYDGFVTHRHDQSIWSLLTKKYGIISHRDPSQFGNPAINQYPHSPYGQIIQLTRDKKLPQQGGLRALLDKIIARITGRNI